MSAMWEQLIQAVEAKTIVGIKGAERGVVESVRALQRGTNAVQRWGAITGRRQSVLNGVIGDLLAEKGSDWAIKMELLGEVSGRRLCVLVHGLCDSETTWKHPADPAHDFGTQLQKELGYSPLYLRYNSGLHISTNGKRLAQLLHQVCTTSAEPIEEIVFIGHSMGGLVVRSACHYGTKRSAPWVKQVKKVIFLGTPHDGNDYEKLGNLTSSILKTIPNPFTKVIAMIGNKRSAGIKDLRFGYLLDEDWKGQDMDALWKDNRHPVPLLKGVDYYIIAATLAKESDNIFTQYFGDGLIQHRSAAGLSSVKSKHLPFNPDHFKIIKGLSHLGLARSRRVYRQIRQWCES